MFIAQKLFCSGLLQSQSLLWYLRTGRSLSNNRDTDVSYLAELNQLNAEKKFWIRFLTRNPIEITEITDDIANAAIPVLEKENVAKVDEIKINEKIRSEKMETNKPLNITNSDVTADQKIKDVPAQLVPTKQDSIIIEAEPKATTKATKEEKQNNETDSLYYNVTDTIANVAKNISNNVSDIYTAASNTTGNITNTVSGVASNVTDTVSKWIWGDTKKEKELEVLKNKESADITNQRQPKPNQNDNEK